MVGGPGAPSGPQTGPRSAQLPRSIATSIITQAKAEYPNEACGLIIGTAPVETGGQAIRYEACRNRAASPYRYEIHPDDLFRVAVAADDSDHVFWAIVHSHVKSPAVPSPTDIGLAFYPDALYVLVSLDEVHADPVTRQPSLRGWRILDGAVHEVELIVA